MMVPPLNQTLWMLLVVSLTIGAAWLGLLLTAEQNGFWDKRFDDRSRPRRPWIASRLALRTGPKSKLSPGNLFENGLRAATTAARLVDGLKATIAETTDFTRIVIMAATAELTASVGRARALGAGPHGRESRLFLWPDCNQVNQLSGATYPDRRRAVERRGLRLARVLVKTPDRLPVEAPVYSSGAPGKAPSAAGRTSLRALASSFCRRRQDGAAPHQELDIWFAFPHPLSMTSRCNAIRQ